MNGEQTRSTVANTYIPHPAPTQEEKNKAATMSATVSLLKVGRHCLGHLKYRTLTVYQTIVIPAAISLSLYLLLSYIIIPLWQRYRGRYSRYLPLDTISTQTSSLRERLADALASFLLPSSWRSNYQPGRYEVSARGESDGEFDENDGEELFEVDGGRREALSLDARRGRDESGHRLSRDLEEGFRDDSDDDDPTANRIEEVLRQTRS